MTTLSLSSALQSLGRLESVILAIFVYSCALLGKPYDGPTPAMRNHLESVDWGTSTSLDNAEADIASGPVNFLYHLIL